MNSEMWGRWYWIWSLFWQIFFATAVTFVNLHILWLYFSTSKTFWFEGSRHLFEGATCGVRTFCSFYWQNLWNSLLLQIREAQSVQKMFCWPSVQVEPRDLVITLLLLLLFLGGWFCFSVFVLFVLICINFFSHLFTSEALRSTLVVFKRAT